RCWGSRGRRPREVLRFGRLHGLESSLFRLVGGETFLGITFVRHEVFQLGWFSPNTFPGKGSAARRCGFSGMSTRNMSASPGVLREMVHFGHLAAFFNAMPVIF